jgi:hypothetical protein
MAQVVSENEDRIIRQFRWGQEPLIIKGNGTGLNRITVSLFDKSFNIVDFLNRCLQTKYFSTYFDVLAKYNNRLATGSIFELKYPPVPVVHTPIDKSAYEGKYPGDGALVQALLTAYAEKLRGLKAGIAQWEKTVDTWFARL